MNIEKLLEDVGLDFKLIDEEKNIKIFKIPNKLLMCFISQKGNKFLFERDIFDYLNGNPLSYCLLLEDNLQSKYYYIPLRKDVNWLKSCFEGCNKDCIFLGKQVLNSQISSDELKKTLKKYC